MKTVMLWALLTTALAFPAQAGQLGEEYVASLSAREAVLDSMATTISMLDTEGLMFASPRHRMRHHHWIARIQDMVTITRGHSESFRSEQSLYNAMCFEFSWRRLRLCWLESLSVCADLMSYEVELMDEARCREDRIAVREYTAENREVGRAFRDQSTRVQRAIADLDKEYGAICMRYMLSASRELDRIGWNP